DVGAAFGSVKRCSGKGKGGKGGGSGSGGGGSGSGGGGGGSGSSGGGSSGGGGSGGTGGGSGGSGGGGGGSGTGGGGTGARCAGSRGGQRQQQQRRSDTQSPQQLREWFLHGASKGSCPYVIRTGDRAGQTCGRLHTQHCCFSRLDDAWRAELGDDVELPRWADLLRSRIAIFDLDFHAILSAIYALSVSAKGDCYRLDSGASACFFRDSTTLSLLSTPVPVRLADPSGGPVVVRSSTVLPCPAVLSGSLSGLHLPLFSANLVSTAALQDAMVTTTTPGGQRVTICTCTRTGRHQAMFTLRPWSSLYTLATEPSQVAASAQVSASGQVAASCSCRLLSHQTLLWHHRLGHPSLPRLRGMHSCLLDHPVLRLDSDRGGEFSSNLLRDFCRGEGILQSFTLQDSPQQNGIATSSTLCWTGEVGDASVFRVWGSRAFVRDTSADKLSPCAIPCAFLGFVPDAPGWQFYHPTSRRVFPSQDVTFDESVPFYCLLPYRSAPPSPPPLFLAPDPPPVDPHPPQGPTPSGVSQVDPLPGTATVQVAVVSGAARGAASGGAASGGAEPGGAESEGAETGGAEPGGVETGDAEPEGVEPGGAASEGAESGGTKPQGVALSGGSAGASPRLSPQQLHEWFVWRACLRSGALGAGGAGGAGAGVSGGIAAAGPGGARTQGTGVAGTGGVEGARAGDPTESGGTGTGSSGAGGAGAGGGVGGTGAGDTEVGGPGVGGAGAGGARAVAPGGALASPLPTPSCYTEKSGGLIERREPASRHVPRLRPSPVPGTHAMTLRPSSIPLRVPVLHPPESSLPAVPDPESDHACAASPTVSRLLATAVTDPSFESAAVSALVAELLDFTAACRLDYTTALVAKCASASPPSVGGECALGTDVLEDRQEDFECLAAAVPRFASMLLAREGDPDAPRIPTSRSYAEAITGHYSSQWQAAMDAEMASWKSTGTYVDEVPPPGANIVDGMWFFRGVDYFQTFSPTSKMTTLRVLLHVAAQRDYELHYLDFSTAFLQGSLHEEIWLRRPPGFTESFPTGPHLRILGSLLLLLTRRCFYAPTPRCPFYVLVYVDDLVFATADTEALTLVKLELQKRHTCTDLGPSALRLPVLLATAHSSVYQPIALISTFGRVLRRAWGLCLVL
ncbi:unnamed protein product, partial [Closterium sp. NIES-53]